MLRREYLISATYEKVVIAYQLEKVPLPMDRQSEAEHVEDLHISLQRGGKLTNDTTR